MSSSFRTRVENAAGIVAFLTLLGAAVAFALADQTSRVSTDLIEVQALEGAATDAALYRANLAIAVAATASSDRETVEAAVTAAHDALDRIAAEAPLASELAADIAILRRSTDQIDQSLGAEDPVAATEVAVRTAGPALNRISSRLEAGSAELRASIEAEQAEAGRAARLSSFSAALIAPALVLWSYRRSARRRLEHQRLQAELQRTYDLGRAKDELIAGLSHQLRTPLTGIQGFSSAVLDQAKSGQLQPELVIEMMGAIYQESQSLGRMIDDFLVTSRNDAGSLSFLLIPTRITEPIRALVDATVRTGERLDVEVADQLVLTDQSRIKQLLRNLIDNAYAHGRGPVELRGFVRDDGYVLQVVDHGPGIAPDEVDKAFSGFIYSGREATVTGSLGLGLFVAQTLAEGLGSQIEYRREVNTTVFEFIIPRVVSSPDSANSYSVASG